MSRRKQKNVKGKLRSWEKNKSRNYARYAAAYVRALKEESGKGYIGDKMDADQFFEAYKRIKLKGNRYNVKNLVAPKVTNEELKKVADFYKRDYEEFKQYFYSLSKDEQRKLIRDYFLSGNAEPDDFVYNDMAFLDNDTMNKYYALPTVGDE